MAEDIGRLYESAVSADATGLIAQHPCYPSTCGRYSRFVPLYRSATHVTSDGVLDDVALIEYDSEFGFADVPSRGDTSVDVLAYTHCRACCRLEKYLRTVVSADVDVAV